MKNPNQIRRNRKPATSAAQTKPAGNDRVRVKVPLSAEEKEVVLGAAKRRGLTPDEFLEKAIRRQLTPSAQTKPETVRIRLRMPGALHAAIARGAKRSGLTISKFVEQAIRETFPLFDAASKGGAK